MVGWLSHRCKLGVGERKLTPKYSYLRRLTLKLVSTKIAISIDSLYSWLGGFFFPQHFAKNIEIKYQ